MAIGSNERKAEEHTVVMGKDGAGGPIFSVLVKRTYDMRDGNVVVRAEETRPLVQVDEHYDATEPSPGTVKYETDLVPYKLATDVALIGRAYAHDTKPVTQMDVSVEIADRKKTIRVIGDRTCVYREGRVPMFTEPVPFTEMEIRYERAYGGKDDLSEPGLPFFYPRNQEGTGVAIKNIPEVVDGLRLPNLEDPLDLLTPDRVILGKFEAWNRQPLPQGLGWLQRTWYPRCSFAGAVPGFVDLDEPMREEALGLVPKGQIALARQFKLPSFDARFNTGASLGLALPYMKGEESLRLVGLTREGPLVFRLPRESPRIMLDIGLGENELEPVIQTVCVRVEDRQVDLVWRGAHPYPGLEWLPEMKRMIVEVANA